MTYCQKCGNQVDDEMGFCPKCGAQLKAEGATTSAPRPEPATYQRDEKTEKEEKSEKREKREKHEKREYGFMGPLIGGAILLFIGLALYLRVSGYSADVLGAWFLVLLGLLVIVGGLYGVIMARRRHPRT